MSSNNSNKIKGFNCPVLGRVSFEDCLAHAHQMRGIPECGFGISTLKMMVENLTRPTEELDALRAANPFTFRVTEITNPCARDVILSATAPIEYVEPQQTYYLSRGTLAHAIRDQYAPEGSQPIGRLSMPIEIVADVPGVGLVEVLAQITGEPDSFVIWQSLKNATEGDQLEIPVVEAATTATQNPAQKQASEFEATLFDYKTTEFVT